MLADRSRYLAAHQLPLSMTTRLPSGSYFPSSWSTDYYASIVIEKIPSPYGGITIWIFWPRELTGERDYLDISITPTFSAEIDWIEQPVSARRISWTQRTMATSITARWHRIYVPADAFSAGADGRYRILIEAFSESEEFPRHIVATTPMDGDDASLDGLFFEGWEKLSARALGIAERSYDIHALRRIYDRQAALLAAPLFLGSVTQQIRRLTTPQIIFLFFRSGAINHPVTLRVYYTGAGSIDIAYSEIGSGSYIGTSTMSLPSASLTSLSEPIYPLDAYSDYELRLIVTPTVSLTLQEVVVEETVEMTRVVSTYTTGLDIEPHHMPLPNTNGMGVGLPMVATARGGSLSTQMVPRDRQSLSLSCDYLAARPRQLAQYAPRKTIDENIIWSYSTTRDNRECFIGSFFSRPDVTDCEVWVVVFQRAITFRRDSFFASGSSFALRFALFRDGDLEGEYEGEPVFFTVQNSAERFIHYRLGRHHVDEGETVHWVVRPGVIDYTGEPADVSEDPASLNIVVGGSVRGIYTAPRADQVYHRMASTTSSLITPGTPVVRTLVDSALRSATIKYVRLYVRLTSALAATNRITISITHASATVAVKSTAMADVLGGVYFSDTYVGDTRPHAALSGLAGHSSDGDWVVTIGDVGASASFTVAEVALEVW
jgi:hypothetical protein